MIRYWSCLQPKLVLNNIEVLKHATVDDEFSVTGPLYHDSLIWRIIALGANEQCLPVILVTSDGLFSSFKLHFLPHLYILLYKVLNFCWNAIQFVYTLKYDKCIPWMYCEVFIAFSVKNCRATLGLSLLKIWDFRNLVITAYFL